MSEVLFHEANILLDPEVDGLVANLDSDESQRLGRVSEAFPAKVQLHSGCDSLWAVFHALETEIDREVASTSPAIEFLNVAVIVVTNPVFDDLR